MKGKKLRKQLFSFLLAAAVAGSSFTAVGVSGEAQAAETQGIPSVQEATLAVPQATGTIYYVDSAAAEGGDGSVESPFQTLAEVNAVTLQPGDGISLKKGSVFEDQQLVPKGRGTEAKPIVINTYGEGSRPVIHAGGFRKTGNENADGTPEYAGHKEAVLIENMEYVYVTGLEVTNDDDFSVNWVTANGLSNKDQDYPRRLGIHVTIDERGLHNSYKTASDGDGYRAYKGVVIDDCYVHDVDGNENRGVNKVDGGIGIEVIFSSSANVFPYFDGVTIQNNRIDKCDRTGIKGIRISDLDNFRYNNPSAEDYDPNCDADNNSENDSIRYSNIRSCDQAQRNYHVVGNYLSDIGGDGILVCETKGALVEHNVLDGQAMRAAGANAGIWSWNAFDTLFRYNESFHGPAYNQDGCSYDSDYFSAGTTFEYNYSHDTPMGFMLLMGGNDTDIVRYNVSQNDGIAWRHVSRNSNTPSYIYNNIFYYDGAKWIYNYSGSDMSKKSNWQLYNNIFYNTNTETASKWGNNPEEADWSKVVTETNIVYEASGNYGGAGEIPNAIYADPKFVNPGAGATAADGVSNWESLKCYEVAADSPAVNAGTFVTVVPKTSSGNQGMWNDTGDRNAAHDFFGNALYNGAADIGIAEMSAYTDREFPVEANASYRMYNPQSKSWMSVTEDGMLQAAAAGSDFILANVGDNYQMKVWSTKKNAYLYLNAEDTAVVLSDTADTKWELKDKGNGLHTLLTGEKALHFDGTAFSMETEAQAVEWQLCKQEGSKFYNAGGDVADGFSADQVFDAQKEQSGAYTDVTAAEGLTGEGIWKTGITGDEVGYKIYAKDGEHTVKLYLTGAGTTMDILVNGTLYQSGYTVSKDQEVLEIPSVYPVDGVLDIRLLAAYNESGTLTKPVLNGISGEKMPMSEVKLNINAGNTNSDSDGNHDGLGGDTAFDGGSGYYTNADTTTEILNKSLLGAKPVPDAGMGTALKCGRIGTDFGYKFKVSPGNYRVKLYFNMPSAAETDGTFDIQINGETVKEGFNVKTAAGGCDKAVDITNVVTAQGGLIDIHFAAETGTALINAIVVEPYQNVAGENLAFGKSTSASGSEAATMTPENAVDANQSTRWASGATSSETWISVDLEKDYMVDTLVVDWTPGAYATDYRIEVMAEDGDWTTARRVSSAYAGINILSMEPVQARYVRVVGEKYNAVWGMSLTELGVFGEEVRGKAAATASTEKTDTTYTTTLGLENIYSTYRTATLSLTYDTEKVRLVADAEEYLAEAALLAVSKTSAVNEDGTTTTNYKFDIKKQGAFKEAANVIAVKFEALTQRRSLIYINTTFTTADGHETKLGQIKTYVPNEFIYADLAELIRQAEDTYAQAETGEKPGQYTEAVKEELQNAIRAAKEVAESASAAEIEAAYQKLEEAVETFEKAVNVNKYRTYHLDFAANDTAEFTYKNASGSAGEGTWNLVLDAEGAATDEKAAKLSEGRFFIRFTTDSIADQTLFTVGNGIRFGYDEGGGNWFYDSASTGEGWGDFIVNADYALTANEEHTVELAFSLNANNLYDLTLWYDGVELGTCTDLGYDTSGGGYSVQTRRSGHNMSIEEIYYSNAPKHTLQVTAGEHGSVSELGSLTTFEEADKTIFFTPEEGYEVDQVKVDGHETEVTGNSYTFTYITNDHSLDVTFKEKKEEVPPEEKPEAAQDLKDAEVTLSQTVYTYNGKEQKPSVTVELDGKVLTAETDYTVTYANNINAGTAKVTLQAKGEDYTGSITKTFTIRKASKSIKVKASKIEKVYGNKAFSLGISTVKGEKLSCTLSNAKVVKVSNAKASIIGCGKVTVTVTSPASKNYSAAAKKQITITVKPKKASLKSVKSSTKGQITVKWAKDSKVSGYEISYAAAKSFKKAKKVYVGSNKKTSQTIKKLTSGKTYYVRIRSYKTVSGKKLYGAYSSVKSTKVKK